MTGFGDRLVGICLALQTAQIHDIERIYYWDDVDEDWRKSHFPESIGSMIDLDNVEFVHSAVDSIPKSDINILNYAYDEKHRPQWKSNPNLDKITCSLPILSHIRLKNKEIEKKAEDFAKKWPAIHVRSTDAWVLANRVNNVDEDQRRDLIVSEIAKAKIKRILFSADSDQPKYMQDFHKKGIKVKKTNEKFDDSNLRQTSMEQMLFDWWVLRSSEKIYTNLWSGFGATAAAAAGIPYIGYIGSKIRFQSSRYRI